MEEIRVAVFEDEVAKRDQSSFAMNKAYQSAGVAIELAYKALILAQGKSPGEGHSIQALHGLLSEGEDKDVLEGVILGVGWAKISAWTTFMDETVDHSFRKYHMFDSEQRRFGNVYTMYGAASIEKIKDVFDVLFRLADPRVELSKLAAQNKRQRERDHTLPPGVTIGPLLAEINLPAGFAPEGKVLGGITIDPKTGAVKLIEPEE